MSPIRSPIFLVIARTLEHDCVPVYVTTDRDAASNYANDLKQATVNRAGQYVSARPGMLLQTQVIEFENGLAIHVEFAPMRQERQTPGGNDETKAGDEPA